MKSWSQSQKKIYSEFEWLCLLQSPDLKAETEESTHTAQRCSCTLTLAWAPGLNIWLSTCLQKGWISRGRLGTQNVMRALLRRKRTWTCLQRHVAFSAGILEYPRCCAHAGLYQAFLFLNLTLLRPFFFALLEFAPRFWGANLWCAVSLWIKSIK